MRMRPRATRRRVRLRALDLAFAAWLVVWIAIGVLTAAQVRALTDLSRTVTTAGVAVERTGETLRSLERLPIVGPDVSARARMVVEAGRQTQRSGRSSRAAVRRLSLLLGLAVAVLPSAPLLVYVPWRVRQARDRRELERMLAEHAGALRDGPLAEVLARRAASRLPLRELRDVSADPWGDIRAGRVGDLARAELRRMAVALPSERRPDP